MCNLSTCYTPGMTIRLLIAILVVTWLIEECEGWALTRHIKNLVNTGQWPDEEDSDK